MILNALALKLKREACGDFRGRHFDAALIVQAVSWCLRYALSYRDIEKMLLERGLEVDPDLRAAVERRPRQLRKPQAPVTTPRR
jgi:transposase-like protein